MQDMKRQCDEKRSIYEYMVAQQKEKGRSKSGKGESFTLQQLQSACSEYNEEATLCIFRLKSLKQGQSRSLLTQAARHHAAQLNFFRKGLKSLEAAEPHVRLVTEQQHIDYEFSGLEDDGREDREGGGNGDDTNDNRKSSFEYRTNKQGQDAVSASRNSTEVDEVFTQNSTAENVELNLEKNGGGLHLPNRDSKGSSYSAPILPERKSDPVERFRQMQQSTARKSERSTTRKSNTYVLPTPLDAKGPVSPRTSSSTPFARPTDLSGRTHNLWHSSPLEQKKHEKALVDCQPQEFTVLKPTAAQKENYSNSTSTHLPPPLIEGVSVPQVDTCSSSDHKKIKRLSFSGPIIGKLYAMKPAFSASGPIPSAELSQHASRVLSHAPIPQSTSSPKISPSASPPFASSPRISELHELPRPPGNLSTKAAKSSASITHSAPLDISPVLSGANNAPSAAANVATRLPPPPLIVARSFTIPPSSQRAIKVNVSKLLESPKVSDNTEDVDSPPLTPISLANINPASMTSELVAHSSQIRGGI
uniref:Uncharacterized protein At2g33490 isoform X2 n=1 Tax=Rhizophora mucronata TaxID=61149 RepID=A0A2P2M048_RHIMU